MNMFWYSGLKELYYVNIYLFKNLIFKIFMYLKHSIYLKIYIFIIFYIKQINQHIFLKIGEEALERLGLIDTI